MAVSSVVSSCAGVRDYLPEKSPLSEDARQAWLAGSVRPSPQSGPPEDVAPVPPLQLFSAYYPRDIVLETRKSGWTMHEYAQVQIGERVVWIAKDSDSRGVQTVTADLPNLESWLPEIPVPRMQGPVSVDDRSSERALDVTITYDNPRGVPMQVDFRAPLDAELEKKRNSSTFDHSRQAASVVLDVRRRKLSGVTAQVAFGAEPARVRRVLGLVPVRALLEQVQSGFAAASMRAEPQTSALALQRPAPGTPWPTQSDETWAWTGREGTGTLRHRLHGVEHRLRFSAGGLERAEVHVEGLDAPGLELRLSAPLPDVTRPFEGLVERRFVAFVGGQAHGYGTIDAEWTEGGATVWVRPQAPRWFRARPLKSRIEAAPGGAFTVESRVWDPESDQPREVVVSVDD